MLQPPVESTGNYIRFFWQEEILQALLSLSPGSPAILEYDGGNPYMLAVTLRIHDLDLGRNGYPSEILEDGVKKAEDLLPAASLITGPWTASAAAPPPPTDIVTRVLDSADSAARRHADFVAIGQVLYDWLL